MDTILIPLTKKLTEDAGFQPPPGVTVVKETVAALEEKLTAFYAAHQLTAHPQEAAREDIRFIREGIQTTASYLKGPPTVSKSGASRA